MNVNGENKNQLFGILDKHVLVCDIKTHILCGLIHALHSRSSPVIQKQGLFPVVIVSLQHIPPAILHIKPEIHRNCNNKLKYQPENLHVYF